MIYSGSRWLRLSVATLALAGVTAGAFVTGCGDEEAHGKEPASPPVAKNLLTDSAPPIEPTAKPEKKVEEKPLTPAQMAEYQKAIQRTAAMTSDPSAQQLAQKHGLNIVNLTWEDTGRFKGSSVGPNISDMTIQVALRNPKSEALTVTCMPVIRFPNFSDTTCDLDPRDFTLLVGNEKSGQPLRRVSLYEFLAEPTAYLSYPDSWKGNTLKTLLAPGRDSKVLVSAQACFLPIPKSGKATFNPVLFNYQSEPKNPAVLTILVTREGTSVTIIDNQRDAFSTGAVWGQRLFHNAGGQRASLTGERESDFRAKGGDTTNAPTVGNPQTKGETGLNMVLLIQVPLKYRERPRRTMMTDSEAAAPTTRSARARPGAPRSNVENAVIGHGELEGPFTEIDNLAIERDPRFPVRVTVQFYKATDNGVVSPSDLDGIAKQINRVYRQSEYVGSLVTQGETGRITEYEGVKVQPPGWWEDFWQRYERTHGVSREEAKRRLAELLGVNYEQKPVSELYLRDCLRTKR